nr:formin-like protein 5 [Aegilops tauschii subsp. strangulata]
MILSSPRSRSGSGHSLPPPGAATDHRRLPSPLPPRPPLPRATPREAVATPHRHPDAAARGPRWSSLAGLLPPPRRPASTPFASSSTTSSPPPAAPSLQILVRPRPPPSSFPCPRAVRASLGAPPRAHAPACRSSRSGQHALTSRPLRRRPVLLPSLPLWPLAAGLAAAGAPLAGRRSGPSRPATAPPAPATSAMASPLSWRRRWLLVARASRPPPAARAPAGLARDQPNRRPHARTLTGLHPSNRAR